MRQKIVRLWIVAGILIFAFIFYKIGPGEIWRNISQISVYNFLVLVGLRILYWILRTINWKVILDAYGENNSLLHLFIARMAGHAVSQLTPTAQVGSEATRIVMAKCSTRRVCIASVIVDKTTEFFSVVFFTIIGVVSIFFRLPLLPGKLKTIFIAGTALATLLLFFLISKQKKGMLVWVVEIIGKLRIKSKFLEKNKEKIKETDDHVSAFYRNHRGAFVISFLLYSLLIMLWVTEIQLGLVYIGISDITFGDSFLITVLGNLAFVFPFIPGSLGIYEATYIGLFALLGRSVSAALTLVLIRRIIALLLAGLGLLGMIPSTRKK